MIQNLLVFICLGLGALPAWGRSVQPLIENGAVVAGSDPLRRSVARLEAPQGWCTATFISARTLLTAGHCAFPTTDVTIKIQDGQGRWWSQSAKRVLRHPRYRLEARPGQNTKVAYDFALVTLRGPMATAIRPVAIRDPGATRGEFDVTVVGFGQFAYRTSSAVLRRGRMRARVEIVPEFFDVPGLHMHAADSRGQYTCPGDSGGPVIGEDAAGDEWLIGVHSLSSGCQNDPDAAESFSALPALVADWIRANLE